MANEFAATFFLFISQSKLCFSNYSNPSTMATVTSAKVFSPAIYKGRWSSSKGKYLLKTPFLCMYSW